MFQKTFRILNLVVILSLFIQPSNPNHHKDYQNDSNDEILRNNDKGTKVGPQILENGLTERVTFGYDGISQSNDESGYYLCCGGYGVAISGDGRYIAFESKASNLVPNDTNGYSDIFVYDRQTGITKRISNGLNGEEANQGSYWVSISNDGSRIAFSSVASNLVEGDTNGSIDVFVYDNNTGETIRVSVYSDGSQLYNAGAWANYPTISGNGDSVAFASGAGFEGSNGYITVVVHKISTGETKNIVMSSDGVYGNQGSAAISSLSYNGRYIVFDSNSDNLVSNDTNGQPDVFVRDLIMGITTRISVTSNGEQGTGSSFSSSISGDGRYVVFNSGSSELAPCKTYCPSSYIHDMLTGTTTPIDITFQGTGPNGVSYHPIISSDGRFVSFESLATNLVPGDTRTCLSYPTDCGGIFIRDLLLNQISLISVDSNNIQGNDPSFDPAISSDGRYVAFESLATNLVSDDTNGFSDIFLRDRGPQSYSISGQITDPGNAPISGIRVKASSKTNTTNPLDTTTDSNGNYNFTSLIPGTYDITPFPGTYAFSPAWHEVTVPPGSPHQNFLGMPVQYPNSVEPLRQFSLPWGNQQYDSTAKTIADWGCLLTDWTMVINYFGSKSNGFQTDPFALDTWLTDHKRYDSGGLIIPGAPLKYAADNGVKLYWNDRFKGRNDSVVDYYLSHGIPVILYLQNPGHFVLAIGKITDGGVNTYAIIDPFFNTSSLRYYGYSYDAYELYTPGININLASVYFSAASPVQLVVTDPMGRRTGFDPNTDQTFDEIPEASYSTYSIADELDSTGSSLESKSLWSITPISGEYKIEVIGTGQGNYTLDFWGTNQLGVSTSQIVVGQTQQGVISNFEVSYSPVDGLGLIQRQLFLPLVIR